MAGYIRQSSFVDGDTITAAIFNNEYNQLLNAFNNATGHKHDGTTAEGPVIGLIGDAGETSPNNKVLIDTTNNYIEFYVEVSSAPVQQLYIADGAIVPVTDSDVDLGTSSLYFKDTYTDTVTTTGNVTVGGDLTVTGSATISGNLTFGDADTDSINLAAEIDSDIIPNTDGTYDLGSATKEWQDLYIDGTANIDSLVADTADINGGTIDGVTIGGTTAGAVTFTDLSDGTITVTAFVDEDDMTSDSATLVPTQQSVKAYVDTTVAATNEVVEDSTPQLGGDLASNGNDILFADNDKAIFGAGSDLQIYHDGSNSIVQEVGTGDLRLAGNVVRIRNSADTENMISAVQDGAVTICYDGNSKLATTSTGIDVTGVITTDGMTTSGNVDFGDSDIARFGAGNDLQIYHDGANSYIEDSGTGSLLIRGTSLILEDAGGNDYIAMTDTGTGGTVEIKHNASTKLATTSTGIDVTGNTESDTVTIGVSSVAGSEKLRVNGTVLTLGGSVSAPAIGIGDTNTGVYAPSAGELGWTVNGTQRLFLDSTGIDVTGVITTDGLTTSADINFGDSDKAIFGAGSDLQIYHDGSSSYIKDGGTGNLRIISDGSGVEINKNTTEYMIRALTDGAVELYHDSNKKLETTSTGIDITGTAVTDGLTVESTLPTITLSETDDSTYSTIAQSFGYLQISADAGNTGAGDGITFKVDNSEAARITSDGNLGIGTASPQKLLHVSDLSGSAQIMISSSDSGVASLQFSDAVGGSVARGYIEYDNSTNHLALGTGALERLRVDSSGNVGIGTTSPFSKLHVGSRGSASVLSYGSSGDGIVFDFYNLAGSPYTRYANIVSSSSDTSESRLGLWTQAASGTSSEKLTILGDGNVGIGQTSPQAGLDLGSSAKGTWSSGNTYHIPSGNAYIKVQGTAAQDNWIGITGGYDQSSGSANLLLQANIRLVNEQAGNYISSEAQSSTSADITFGKMVGGSTTSGNSTKSEFMRIDSSGNLLVGKTATDDFTVVGTQIDADGFIAVTRDGSVCCTI